MTRLLSLAEDDGSGLRRTLGPVSLGALGVATIVGAGIFVLAGDAAGEHAGPAVTISFLLAGLAAAASALCYAEMASILPVSGSSYSYAYGVLGVFAGWVVGWCLLLEYLIGGSAVAAGWGGYVDNVLSGIGIHLPAALLGGPFGGGGVVNAPAMVIVALVVWLLVTGVRESARATNVLVAMKVGVLLLFVGIGAFYVSAGNLTPFVPPNTGGFGAFGWSGVLRAAALVFFSYIGFDAVCTAAQEAREPRRTVPIGVLASVVIASLLYVAVALVMTGMVPYSELVSPDALSVALATFPTLGWLERLMDVVAMLALGATVLATLYAQSRILVRMAEDGLLPEALRRVDPGSGTPRTATLACGILCAVLAALVPLTTLGELISAGTLLAFTFVAIALLVLRRTDGEVERGFRVPGGPVIPLAAIAVNLVLIALIPLASLLRVALWFAVGCAVYLGYGRTRARRTLAEGTRGAPA
jgi:APA family basic amino acid/polyamine antiporter